MATVEEKQENYMYDLNVEIRSGSSLADKKMIGGHAVYIAIDVNGETKRTKTTDNIHNPVWNESFNFKLNQIPELIELRVRDDRTLLPNLDLGSYTIPLKEKLLNYNASQVSVVVEDGEVALRNVLTGTLDVYITFSNPNLIENSNIINSNPDNVLSTPYDSATLLQSKIEGPFEEVKKAEFEKLPEELNRKIEIFDETNEINDNNNNNTREVHTLPTIHVKEQPIIVEKEVEFIKPVEVHQKIIHRVIPTIIEKPTIVEKHEHYRAPSEIIRHEEKIVREKVEETGFSNSEQQAIEDLKARRQAEFNDVTPVIQYEKEQIKLDTSVHEKPMEIREKEVVYEQPIQIERKQIEHIKEKVVENVKLEKEHIHEKVQPEIIRKDVQVINDGDHFYSQKDTTTSSSLVEEKPILSTSNQNVKESSSLNQQQAKREKERIEKKKKKKKKLIIIEMKIYS